jgi:hypothetical protein
LDENFWHKLQWGSIQVGRQQQQQATNLSIRVTTDEGFGKLIKESCMLRDSGRAASAEAPAEATLVDKNDDSMATQALPSA